MRILVFTDLAEYIVAEHEGYVLRDSRGCETVVCNGFQCVILVVLPNTSQSNAPFQMKLILTHFIMFVIFSVDLSSTREPE